MSPIAVGTPMIKAGLACKGDVLGNNSRVTSSGGALVLDSSGRHDTR